jgi:diguanylate cyclase
LRSWLGLGAADVAPAADATPADATPTTRPVEPARQDLLREIIAFLDRHQLPLTGFNLAAVHDYVTATDLNLVRAIDRRLSAQMPLSSEWLETEGADTSREDDRRSLAALMTRLEANLDEIGLTTHAARSAASHYSLALEAHVGGLADGYPGTCGLADEPGPDSGSRAIVAELAGLARSMLNRTRELEQDMARSELHTRSLRRSLDQARRSADRDFLTGLPNRRAFEHIFESEIALARSGQESLCVAFCDIDEFKQINDTHGHDAGDRVLRAVAQNLARISDDRCHVARHGGEEFVVLLRGLSLAAAWDLLDDTRACQAERRLVNRATEVPFGKITFSVGIADVFAHADPRSALRAADQALYRAKAEGRNRVITAMCEDRELPE